MEKECFVQTMDSLLSDLKVKEVVTDAHPQISALLSEFTLCCDMFLLLCAIIYFSNLILVVYYH